MLREIRNRINGFLDRLAARAKAFFERERTAREVGYFVVGVFVGLGGLALARLIAAAA